MSDNLHPLLQELKKVVNELPEYQDSKKDESIHIQTKYQRVLARLCYILERILDHGIQDVSLFGTGTHFWSYLEQVDKCLPGAEAKEILRKVKELQKSNVGRARVFFRITLNEGSLTEYLRALIWNRQLTSTYYRDTAIVALEDQANAFLSIIESLKNFKFQFILKDKNLEDSEYWQRQLARSRVGSISASNTMLAPPNLVELKSGLLPNIEAINAIIEQAEHQERDMQDMQRKILNYKVEVEKERQEKEIWVQKSKKMEEEMKQMKEKLHEYEVALTLYANHRNSSHKTLLEDKDMLDALQISPELIQEQIRLFELTNPHQTALEQQQEELISAEAAEEKEINEQHESLMKRLNEAKQTIQEMKSQDEGIKQRIMKIPTKEDLEILSHK